MKKLFPKRNLVLGRNNSSSDQENTEQNPNPGPTGHTLDRIISAKEDVSIPISFMSLKWTIQYFICFKCKKVSHILKSLTRSLKRRKNILEDIMKCLALPRNLTRIFSFLLTVFSRKYL